MMGLNIAFISAEAAPFTKTGGLADVAGALPRALGRLGHNVLLLHPQYRGIAASTKPISKNVRVIFIKNDAYFDRDGVYGVRGTDYADNLERYSFFCAQALEVLKERKFRPDIVHAHDWHAGLVPLYLKTRYRHDPFFVNTRTLFTIHNLAYQGLFGPGVTVSGSRLPIHELFAKAGLSYTPRLAASAEFWEKLSFMKAGLTASDALSTVSPTYAEEILGPEQGCGLDHVLRARKDRLSGILNGIDTDVWKIPAGTKTTWKASLQKECGFAVDHKIPVIGMVTRLAEQKGLDLLIAKFEEFARRPLQFVLLGTGEPRYEDFFKEAERRHPSKVRSFLGFSSHEAWRIYAGSDFFLMPSRFEPCGLGQLISFRYGTLPIVHGVGGLKDTVTDASVRTGNGFVFSGYRPEHMLGAVDRALDMFAKNPKRITALRTNARNLDTSWNKSAKMYVNLYRSLMEAPPETLKAKSFSIGLTGVICSGKSEVLRILKQLGAKVFGADNIAHELLEKGTPEYARVVAAAGREVLGVQGWMDRERLRTWAFRDKENLLKLESIVHPGVRRRIRELQEKNDGILVFEVPLLFEKGLDEFMDETWCVTLTNAVWHKYAEKRGLSKKLLKEFAQRQWPLSEKAAQADVLIQNNGSFDDLTQQVKKVYSAVY